MSRLWSKILDVDANILTLSLPGSAVLNIVSLLSGASATLSITTSGNEQAPIAVLTSTSPSIAPALRLEGTELDVTTFTITNAAPGSRISLVATLDKPLTPAAIAKSQIQTALAPKVAPKVSPVAECPTTVDATLVTDMEREESSAEPTPQSTSDDVAPETVEVTVKETKTKPSAPSKKEPAKQAAQSVKQAAESVKQAAESSVEAKVVPVAESQGKPQSRNGEKKKGTKSQSESSKEAKAVEATEIVGEPKGDQAKKRASPNAVEEPKKKVAKVAEQPKKKIQLSGGVVYEVLVEGKNDKVVAKNGKKVEVRYMGCLAANGKKFDSGKLSFTPGAGEVVKGFDVGVIGMKIGEKRRVLLPSKMAYGKQRVGNIPANSDLIFEITLLKA